MSPDLDSIILLVRGDYMIRIKQKGDFKKVDKYFNELKKNKEFIFLAKYGIQGVTALTLNTPVDTGLTASSWTFDIIRENHNVKIVFENRNVQDGYNIALLLQYGHGTRNGGYVVGRDYINPVIQPLFDKMAEEAWKEVKSL